MELVGNNQSNDVTNTSLHAIDGDDDVSAGVTLFITIFMSIASATGTVGNLLILTTLILVKKLYQDNVMNIYIGNLALTDFVICAVLMPFHLFTIRSAAGPPGCKAMGFLSLLLLYVSIISLAAIALNRFALFTWPRDRYKRCYTQRNIGYSILAIWSACSASCCPILAGFGRVGYNRKLGTCFFPSDDLLSYVYIMTVGHAVIAFPAIGFTSYVYIRIVLIYRKMRCHLKTHTARTDNGGAPAPRPEPRPTLAPSEVVGGDSNVLSNSVSCSMNTSGAKRDNRPSWLRMEWINISRGRNTTMGRRFQKKMFIILALFIIWLTFIVCWLPLLLVYSVDYYKVISANYYHVALTLAFANSAINPILYGVLNRDFRGAFSRILGRTDATRTTV